MEFICSMTGKSPSTTGAGSEGALTKGPFNALPPIIDLNNALVSFMLTGHNGFVTAAGYVGPKVRVDHDVSLIVPEVWCRMEPDERDPKFLIANHYLEKLRGFRARRQKGPGQPARLPHQRAFCACLFWPRLQSSARRVHRRKCSSRKSRTWTFSPTAWTTSSPRKSASPKCISTTAASSRRARRCSALLHIMLNDEWEGKNLDIPEFRELFTRENLLASDWYAARLAAKQEVDRQLWKRHVEYLNHFLRKPSHEDVAESLEIGERLTRARKTLEHVESPDYLKSLQGTLGAEPVENYL